MKRLSQRAGITERISPHSLRQSFITVALDVPSRCVTSKKRASHTDLRTTMRYDARHTKLGGWLTPRWSNDALRRTKGQVAFCASVLSCQRTAPLHNAGTRDVEIGSGANE